MDWNTSRFDAEQPMDSGSWAQIPGRKQQESGYVERRRRHGRRFLRDTVECLGAMSMVFTITVLVLRLGDLI